MELRVLRYFLAVAREGSVTGAARFLNVTQPTLSRQIRELEEELGQQLFVRGSHSVSLTAPPSRLYLPTPPTTTFLTIPLLSARN